MYDPQAKARREIVQYFERRAADFPGLAGLVRAFFDAPSVDAAATMLIAFFDRRPSGEMEPLETIVGCFASKHVVLRMLEQRLGDRAAIARVAARSYPHPIGFDKLVLYHHRGEGPGRGPAHRPGGRRRGPAALIGPRWPFVHGAPPTATQWPGRCAPMSMQHSRRRGSCMTGAHGCPRVDPCTSAAVPNPRSGASTQLGVSGSTSRSTRPIVERHPSEAEVASRPGSP